MNDTAMKSGEEEAECENRFKIPRFQKLRFV